MWGLCRCTSDVIAALSLNRRCRLADTDSRRIWRSCTMLPSVSPRLPRRSTVKEGTGSGVAVSPP